MSIDPLTAAIVALSIIAAPESYAQVLTENDKNIVETIIQEHTDAVNYRIDQSQLAEERMIEQAIEEEQKRIKAEEDRLAAIKEAERLRTLTVHPLEAYTVTSNFGTRTDPITGAKRSHTGTDYRNPTGAPVKTIKNGTVKAVGEAGSYGKRVIITHENGVESLYAHLSGYKVQVGQKVSAGDLIGLVGSTGRSTGPHLHLEIHINGVNTNAEAYLNKHVK